MSGWKNFGLLVAGAAIAAAVGGGTYYVLRRRKKKQQEAAEDEDKEPQHVTPSRPPKTVPSEQKARGEIMRRVDIPDSLEAVLNSKFKNAWPPDDEVIDELTSEDVIAFAVESEPVPGYPESQQELISAKVLSVEKSMVRGRIIDPVAFAEHHGSHAGHGFRVGDLVEVPRTSILIAARPNAPKKTGYGSKGAAAETFKPSHETKKTYKVRPGTPYDLVLPYRTAELEWVTDEELVKIVKIVKVGEKGLIEQIMFTEDSMRGSVTVRALDRDPKEGVIFVARWDFEIDP